MDNNEFHQRTTPRSQVMQFQHLHHLLQPLPHLKTKNHSSMVRLVTIIKMNLLLQSVQDAGNTFARIVLITMALVTVNIKTRHFAMTVVKN